jgi:simple sugar transport system ATP-binding protein
MQSERSLALRAEGVTKRFGALTACDRVDLELCRGEILALLGENGAGKTTLMNILFGHYVADEGRILMADGGGTLLPLQPGSPHAALAAGIGMVHQHFTLADNLTAFDNITLGAEPLLRLRRRRRSARARIAEIMREAGIAVELDTPTGRLAVGERQRVEIVKALYRGARVLILDEPTAVLTPQESERLFTTLRRLAASGLAVVFISHKLNEVLAAADRIAVLRAGAKVADGPRAGADAASLAELMVGRPVQKPLRAATRPGLPLLDLEAISVADPSGRQGLEEVSLLVRAGEILGVAGVSGNGQGALAALLSGLARPRAGTLRIAGEVIHRLTPHALNAAGLGRIPEDRHRDGIVGSMRIWENLAVEDIRAPAAQRFGFLRFAALKSSARAKIAAYDVRCPGPDAQARTLSGGNIQKLILARVLDRAPRVVLADQPTRGLDVGAVAAIHHRLLAARSNGAAIVLISEDLDELFALADEIAVLYRGRLIESAPTEAWTTRALGLAMAGEGGAIGRAA